VPVVRIICFEEQTRMQTKEANQHNGFTLLEILIGITIFSLVIVVTSGIFVSSVGSQRKAMELYALQREGGYLLETISRELRMATYIDDSQANNDDSDITFTNYEGESVEYCLAQSDGSCSSTGTYFSRNGEVINSPEVKIENLKFYVSNTFTLTQPLVTISMKLKARNGYQTELCYLGLC